MRAAHTDRTRLLSGRRGVAVLPYWMERQLDPAGAAWEPDDGMGPLRNTAARDVVPVGTIGAPQVAMVDPRGLVTPAPGGWSLDWWIGADDRWHVPSREVAVRQSVLDGAPVVETAMRVPGGDIVERVWAFADPDAGPVLAVELRHDGRVPVAVALAVRPYDVDGASEVGQVTVDPTGIVVDGRRAMWLPKPASRIAASSWRDGDVSQVVFSGAASDATEATASCDLGLAQAAVVVPLSHGTSFVVLVPLDAAAVDVSAPAPQVVPPADAVARGWASHRSRAARIVLPDSELSATFDAAVGQVMLAAAGARLDGPGTRTTAAVTVALDRLGLRDEVDPVIAGLPDGQRLGGQLGGDDTDDAATGAVLVAAGTHWALGRDNDLVSALAGPLAAGAHHRPGAGRLVRKAAPLGPLGAAWTLAGARRVAVALASSGQPDAAAAIDASTTDLEATVEQSFAELAPSDVVNLVWLGVVAADSDRASEALDRMCEHQLHDRAVVGRAGVDPAGTARLAAVELRRGGRSALDRLEWLVDAAGPDRAWPQSINPRTGAGCAGAAWSPVVAAAFVELVADLLCVVDEARGELAVLPVMPEGWLGAGIEAHGLHTPLGVVSFAVRWHGERPALLWEVEPHPGSDAVRLTAPGLDAGWSSAELRGDALLAAPVSEAPAPSPSPGPSPADDLPRDPPPAEGTSFV